MSFLKEDFNQQSAGFDGNQNTKNKIDVDGQIDPNFKLLEKEDFSFVDYSIRIANAVSNISSQKSRALVSSCSRSENEPNNHLLDIKEYGLVSDRNNQNKTLINNDKNTDFDNFPIEEIYVDKRNNVCLNKAEIETGRKQNKDCDLSSFNSYDNKFSDNNRLEYNDNIKNNCDNESKFLAGESNINHRYIENESVPDGINSRHDIKENSLGCNFCKKKFKYISNLKKHEKNHTSERPFKCKFCEKTFAIESQCNYHEAIHTDEKHFDCKICDKKFNRRYNLNIHERIHTCDKPFKCKFCDKTFYKKDIS